MKLNLIHSDDSTVDLMLLDNEALEHIKECVEDSIFRLESDIKSLKNIKSWSGPYSLRREQATCMIFDLNEKLGNLKDLKDLLNTRSVF